MRKLISLGVTLLAVAGSGVVAGPTTVSTPSVQSATVWARADAHCALATVGVGIVQPVCHR